MGQKLANLTVAVSAVLFVKIVFFHKLLSCCVVLQFYLPKPLCGSLYQKKLLDTGELRKGEMKHVSLVDAHNSLQGVFVSYCKSVWQNKTRW